MPKLADTVALAHENKLKMPINICLVPNISKLHDIEVAFVRIEVKWLNVLYSV